MSVVKIGLDETKKDQCPLCNESILMRPFFGADDEVVMWQGHCLCEKDKDTINVYQVPVKPVSFITLTFSSDEGDDD